MSLGIDMNQLGAFIERRESERRQNFTRIAARHNFLVERRLCERRYSLNAKLRNWTEAYDNAKR